MRTASFLLFIFAMFLTLSGAWIQWRAPWYRMGVEEAVKDGKLTPEQAQWRLRAIHRAGMILTVVGAAILVASLA